MTHTRRFTTRTADETAALAARLAVLLHPGDMVGLHGELGAGKTVFTRGLVVALADANVPLVTSPTFTLLNEYPTDPPVYHFDFYRLTDLDDLETTGFWDVVDRQDGIIVAEWIQRIPTALDLSGWYVRLLDCGNGERKVDVTVPVDRHLSDELLVESILQPVVGKPV